MRNILFAMTVSLCVGVATASAANPSARHIQRSMKMMEESTAEHPATLRVFFYGQSIVAQPWTDTICAQLKERYPTVNFEFCKRAIGGFEADNLSRTAVNDLYPWNPDLLFFHVYGRMEKYEEIVRTVRERTAAEIILWTSHLSKGQDPRAMLLNRDGRSRDIMDIARRYRCMVIDLNQKWCNHLLWEGIAVEDLLNDSIHLNPEGLKLYAQCIGEELVRIPSLGDNPESSGTINLLTINDLQTDANGNAILRFTGNRVVAVSNGDGKPDLKAELLLDGKPLTDYRELWGLTRTSTGPFIWMPAIKNVDFTVPLQAEHWELKCLPDSTKDGTRLHFRVKGSKTGDDGEGTSDADFASPSGRVVILKSDWHVAWPLAYTKHELPDGYTVTWDSYPLFTTPFAPQPAGTRTLLLQGCSPETHTLTFKGAAPQELGITSIQVNCPPKTIQQ